jgi:hypothetical protein
MPVSPHLLRKLQETLGAEAADDLVRLMDGMDANRGDIGELRHEMQLGFARMDSRFERVDANFARVDARFEQLQAMWDERFQNGQTRMEGLIDKGQAKMEALFERGLREQTRFFFLAWAVLLAAIIGIYAR